MAARRVARRPHRPRTGAALVPLVASRRLCSTEFPEGAPQQAPLRRLQGSERRYRMPQRAWSQERERQYEHVKEGLLDRGRDEDTAEEIAARTVNKERARAGEAKPASRTSTDDLSSGRRGGLRSHKGSGGRTYDQLYNEARQRGGKGRSPVKKRGLERALRR